MYRDDIQNVSALRETLSKKEFQQSMSDGVRKPDLTRVFQFKRHQRFIRNFINPNTPYQRILLKHFTGTGKTLSSIGIAMEFIAVFREMAKYNETAPNVNIIGFSKRVFFKELLRRPEFGFISTDEMADLARLQKIARNGSKLDQDALMEFEARIRKRLSSHKNNGFYKFYGYKEFFNRLFIVKEGVAIESFDNVIAGIASGNIKINESLVHTFANSLVICDEIHNAYNSIEINNYGTAIFVLLTLFDKPDFFGGLLSPELRNVLFQSVIRAVYMSATPISSNPTEIVDLFNLLIPLSRNGIGRPFTREDFFADGKLIPSLVGRIRDLIRGYVSFFRDEDETTYPSKSITGDELRIGGKRVPYLKFVRCEMSAAHKKAFIAEYFEDNKMTLPPDGYALNDIIFPGGVFRTRDIKQTITSSSQAWRDRNKINFVTEQTDSGEIETVTGDFAALPTLAQYSAKYAQMMRDIIAEITSGGGKIMIVHQYVRTSGVILIREILIRNGFVDEFGSPSDDTLCVICGNTMKKHRASTTHRFAPARFIMAHGEINKKVLQTSIDKYNHPDNANGHLYMVLIGSKILREAYDFNSIRHLWVMSAPPNIPSLIQIFGRAVRSHSHMYLSADLRHVEFRLYVNVLRKKSTLRSLRDASGEERKYFEKSQEYVVIQAIDKIFNEMAADANIVPKSVHGNLKQMSEFDNIGTLPYQPFDKAPPANHMDDRTFDIYYQQQEVADVKFILQQLFIISSAWRHADLRAAVADPPFMTSINTATISDNAFSLALDELIYNRDKHSVSARKYMIVAMDDFYITFPNLDRGADANLSPLHVALGDNMDDLTGYPDIDYDTWDRTYDPEKPASFDITADLRTSNISYNTMKYRFFERFGEASINTIPISIEVYGFEFHKKLAEDSIRYVFNILTNPSMPYSELHEFYFKMIYFYDKIDMIVFATEIEGTKMEATYKPYLTRGRIKIPSSVSYKGRKIEILEEDNKYNHFLMSSIIKSSETSEPFNIDRINAFINKERPADKQIKRTKPSRLAGEHDRPMRIKPPKVINKVFSYMLPIGHFINTEYGNASTPFLYIPDRDMWEASRVFVEHQGKSAANSVENDLVIGYYERSPNKINLQFKTRTPIHLMTAHDDTRMKERGSTCTTRKKHELDVIIKQLGIKLLGTENVKDICNLIKLELLNRELRERRRWHKSGVDGDKKRIRWFYFHFEQSAF